ncbi:MAG: hypothetical protein JXR96_04360 [Deltaproteobacteria bacterium]|nr:hypothetical protein [Deltaproteobacteria bacterium]
MADAAHSQTGLLSRLTSPSLEQARDTAMAFALIGIILAWLTGQRAWILAAGGLLLLAMIWPGFFRPAAYLWFGLARLLGALVSRLLLSLLFFALIVPVGLIRRAAGADPMQRKAWRSGQGSVFRLRDPANERSKMSQPF